MKRTFLIGIILVLGLNANISSQNNKISLQSGVFYPLTKFKNAEAGFYGGYNFTHKFANNYLISSHFTMGKTRYLEEEFSNVLMQYLPISETNAELYLYNFGLLTGKKFDFNKLNVALQGGIALFLVNKQDIPLALIDTEINNPTYHYSVNDMGFSIPVEASVNYQLLKNLEIGLLGGLYLPNPFVLRLGVNVSILF